MSIKDQAAIVGVGATPYYKRGQSYPEDSELSLACKAILSALDDAGLTRTQIFASGGLDEYVIADLVEAGAEPRGRARGRITPEPA